MLMQLYRPLAAEATALGPMALTVLGDLIPGLDTPEKIVLNMLLFQSLPLEDVARSTHQRNWSRSRNYSARQWLSPCSGKLASPTTAPIRPAGSVCSGRSHPTR